MKHQMIYQVCIGKEANSKLYQYCIESVAAYCQRYNIQHMVQTSPLLNFRPDPEVSHRSKESYEKHGGFLPIFEKENAFEYLPVYEQIAIIDADIYIKKSAPNIFDELSSDYAFGAVPEREMPLTNEYRKKIKAYSMGQYGSLKHLDWKWNDDGALFYNMGLMVFNQNLRPYFRGDSPQEFLTRKEFKQFVDGQGNWKWSTDQTLLNVWIKQEGIPTKHLDWKWNALYKGIEDKHLGDAHFIHFFLKDKLPNRGESLDFFPMNS